MGVVVVAGCRGMLRMSGGVRMSGCARVGVCGASVPARELRAARSFVGLALLALLGATGAGEANAAVAGVCVKRFAVPSGNRALALPYCSNVDLAASNGQVT